MLEKANQEIINSEKIFLKGKLTDVERFQKIIDTWSLTSESLKNQVIYYFKNYDPLNSVYIMAFSGARGNLSQVRQLVGMRGLMSDPSGEIMNLPIKKKISGFFKSRVLYFFLGIVSISELYLLLKRKKPDYIIIHLLTLTLQHRFPNIHPLIVLPKFLNYSKDFSRYAMCSS